MEFSLTYRGTLHSNGNRKHKHAIRKSFHKQLKVLWAQHPLVMHHNLLHKENPDPDNDYGVWTSLIFSQDDYEFVPLVNKKLHTVVELDIILFRPEPHGEIITQSGDIDNRLKTLFDALQMPKDNQMPDVPPEEHETPFFCLLQDDNLITKVSVKNEQLLEPVEDDSDVLLIIQVTTKKTMTTMKNLSFV